MSVSKNPTTSTSLASQAANAGERSLWGTISFCIQDPKQFSHIHSLNNDDPSSFWYTLRPNLFNIDIPDESDYANLINTDRSDFTDTPVSAGKGVGMLETGFTYTRVLKSTSHMEMRTLPETLLRYGITDEFELRIRWLGYSMIDEKNSQTGQTGSIFGTNSLDLGVKYEIFQQQNWIPLTTVLTGVLIPSQRLKNGMNLISPKSQSKRAKLDLKEARSLADLQIHFGILADGVP